MEILLKEFVRTLDTAFRLIFTQSRQYLLFCFSFDLLYDDVRRIILGSKSEKFENVEVQRKVGHSCRKVAAICSVNMFC